MYHLVVMLHPNIPHHVVLAHLLAVHLSGSSPHRLSLNLHLSLTVLLLQDLLLVPPTHLPMKMVPIAYLP